MPCLFYAVDVIPMDNTEIRSINFPVIKVLMKIFRTSPTSNIRDYQFYFNFHVETYVILRATKFLRKYSSVVNVLCETFAPVALHQLSSTQFAHDY